MIPDPKKGYLAHFSKLPDVDPTVLFKVGY